MANNAEKPARFDECKKWLVADLNDEQRLYVRRWIAKYVTQWGNVPIDAAGSASREHWKPFRFKK